MKTPPSDWVAYVVTFSVVIAMMYGKYLIAKGDQPIQEVLEEDLETIEHTVEEAIEDIEKKIND